MGLVITHNCWNGPYSSFNEWRNRLAEAAGYELFTEPIETGNTKFTLVYPKIPHESKNDSTLKGVWIIPPKDPILVLLAHSDSDGHIYPAEAIPLAVRLDALAEKLSEYKKDIFDPFNYYGTKTKQFAEGLRLAASRDEVVSFI